MPVIRADLRQIRYEPQPEAMAVVEKLAPRVKQDLIDLAKAFERIDRTVAYTPLGCASIGEFAIRQGLSPFLGQTLRFVGRAFLAFPWVEPDLRAGRFGFDQAESLGQLASYEGTVREEDDWPTWARFLPLRELRRRVRRRIEEVRQGTRTLVPFHTELTREAYADYERARILASRRAKKVLTRGQTIAAVLRDFNRRHDPQERAPRKRRAGDTSAPGCRTVPAEVIRACLERYGDRCWVPGCTNEIFLEHMHRVPKSQGGNQEAPNIDRGCHRHHVLYDAGRMWIVDTNEHALPIFETDRGWILHPDHPGRPLPASAGAPADEPRAPSSAPAAPEKRSGALAPDEAPDKAPDKAPDEARERGPDEAPEQAAEQLPSPPRKRTPDRSVDRTPKQAPGRPKNPPPGRVAEPGPRFNGRAAWRDDGWSTGRAGGTGLAGNLCPARPPGVHGGKTPSCKRAPLRPHARPASAHDPPG